MALSTEQLDWLDETKEVRIETSDGSRVTKTIIWIVVTEGVVYVRSVRGPEGRWYQRLLENPEAAIDVNGRQVDFRAVPVVEQDEIDAVSDALRDKYPPGGSLDRMTRDEVLDTTLRLQPIG
ncbi:MAG: DUF2255 family protein [Serratia inhibens]|uniref:DUF2255 family protein n=1 Tax=Serratia inhibens TaxID=2338073 RepID=UPI003C7DCCC9